MHHSAAVAHPCIRSSAGAGSTGLWMQDGAAVAHPYITTTSKHVESDGTRSQIPVEPGVRQRATVGCHGISSSDESTCHVHGRRHEAIC